jgi:apolipoprotein N-acyltransferase
MKKKYLVLLSLLSGLALALSWPRDGITWFSFVAFIPLLILEDVISSKRNDFHRFAVLVYSYPGFFLWNALTTWWIWNSTAVGALGALVANSFFMAVVFSLFSYTKKHLYGKGSGFLILPLYWISFEYWHLNWDMSWPWLNIGNVFASTPEWVQWYEFTGSHGGTLWVLLLNIVFYKLIMLAYNYKRMFPKKFALAGLAVLLLMGPLLVSYFMYTNYEEQERPVEVVVVQANIDPYAEQYDLPSAEVIERNIILADSLVSERTDFVVSPESTIQEAIWEHRFLVSPGLNQVRQFVKRNPGINYIIGGSSFKEYLNGEMPSLTARKFRDADAYYDAYNTVFFIDNSSKIEFYHKSKLTPAVEKMPFPRYLKFLENFAINLGGTVGSLGTDEYRKVYYRTGDSLGVSAAICYESVYGEFFSRFVRNGAELMFIVTNDGWWGNTPGHRQHFVYSRLRAVETRRSIARSANTGISAFINQRGDIIKETKYWQAAVIKESINANNRLTVYSKHGNYIARISSFVSVMLLLIAISIALRKRKLLNPDKS